MKKSNQKGFAFLELLLVLVVVAGVAIIGLRVVGNHKDTQASTTSATGTSSIPKETTTAATVPTITSTSDLDKASTALDQNDNSADDNHDAGALNSQAEDF